MKDNQRKARDVVATLEKSLGISMDVISVGDRDQYNAALRDDLIGMGVDPTDQQQLLAVFTGAFILAATVLPYSMMSPTTAGSVALVLRGLADRADDGFEEIPDLEEPRAPWWRRAFRNR